eukprot:1359204-Amorphochlora_amoeboformis.AAC.1
MCIHSPRAFLLKSLVPRCVLVILWWRGVVLVLWWRGVQVTGLVCMSMTALVLPLVMSLIVFWDQDTLLKK